MEKIICNKCGEYLIPDVYHDCTEPKVSIYDISVHLTQQGKIKLSDYIKVCKSQSKQETLDILKEVLNGRK
jgi:hypothetical protein